MDIRVPYLLLKVMINALSIGAAVKLVDGISFTGQWWKLIIIGALFGVVNSFIKPLVQIFTLPLIVLSLGLFTLVVNAMMLGLTIALSGPLSLGLSVNGFWPAFWGALIISIVSTALTWVSGVDRLRRG